MKMISVSEFRKNIKKYADIASSERVIVNRGEGRAFANVPIDALEDTGYSPEFVKSILDAEKSVDSGDFTRVSDTKNIWRDIV